MTRSILFYGQPPGYFLQLLRKFGSTDLYTGKENWNNYDWIGVADDQLPATAVSTLAQQALSSNKTFGLINAPQQHLEKVSSIIGIWPAEPSVGVIVTPWHDDAGKPHYKAVFFRRFGVEKEEAMIQEGKSPEALKYLLLGNAMRMHVQATEEKWLPKITAKLPQQYAIIPIQKRPVTYYANNIHKISKVQFMHQGELYLCCSQEADLTAWQVQLHHRLSSFSKDAYYHGKAQSVSWETDMSYRADNWYQWFDYHITTKLITEDEQYAATHTWELISTGEENAELKDVSFVSTFTVKTHAGTTLPRFKMLIDFDLIIRQQFDTMIVRHDSLPRQTSTPASFTATLRLSTEWIDAGVLLQ
ncbi:MAG TPA: hypothetical protein VD996_13960 [Chitinophagaceae bacterium]|nr:hypothetical protein [Chitinophagaceae bacterium]